MDKFMYQPDESCALKTERSFGFDFRKYVQWISGSV